MNCNNNTAPLVGSSAASSCNNGCSPKDINVICRKIIIPYGQGILAIEGDENSSSRTFIIPDTTEEGISLVDKTFSILVENANKQQWRTVVTDEDKIIEDNYIKIKWDIGKNETAVAGILKVSLEAEGENFKWQTYSGDFSIASSLYDEDRQIDPSLNLQTKDINRNGRYYPDPGYNGFSDVNVNIELDFIPTAEKGAPNGVATLDELGKVFVSQLPEGVVIDNNYVHTDNNFTNTDKEKLNNLSNYDDTQVKSDINIINEKIPTQATNNNQLADKDFVNSSLNSITAFYITKNADGDQFNSKAELDSATEFYSGGEVRVPTRNDYCIVLEDETKDNSTTRYIYQNEQWEFQYVVNETPLTSEQVKAINSGITPELVAKLQDIDLTEYVKNTDYASQTKGGTIRTSSNFNIYSNGQVYCGTRTFSQYESDGNVNFISKGTLENVILGKELTNKTYVDTGLSNKADKIYVIENENATELEPNKLYKWGEVESLNLTLGTPIGGILNEYMFEFISGATPTTLTLPDSVKWESIPNIEANKKYQISIVDDIALMVGV